MRSIKFFYLKSSSIRSLFLFIYCALITPLLAFLVLFNKSFIFEWEIISIRGSFITFPIILDPVGVRFRLIVCFISACVIIFSSSYMEQEIFLSRFIWLVIIFVLSMNALIFIPRLISLLLGWDGLGIVSFALVVYYQNNKSLGAGILTALANRLGDVALLTAIGLCLTQGHWNIFFMENQKFLGWVCLCILLAGITKRAQVPFSSWLPAAIAAPTPVSALVHSSTLVTAGVFLLIRFFPFVSSWEYFSTILLFISVLTLFIAGLRAIYEFDIKKIIALSTLRQLGVIIIRLALGLPYLALFHLYTHALFKAILFLCAGIIIHNNKNTQDLRALGRLWKDIPLTIRCLNIANLALCGAPFLRGFYSKDLILEIFLFSPCNILILIIIFLATGMTSAYSLRLSIYTIWGQPNYSPCHQIHDEDKKSTFPIIFLRIMTIIGGTFLQHNILNFNMSLFLPRYLKFLTIGVILVGGWLIYITSKKSFLNKILYNGKLSFLSLIWFLVPISTLPIISLSINTRIKIIKSLDHGWLEIIGGRGTFSCFKSIAQINQIFQKNTINLFLLVLLILILIIIFL